MQPQPWLYRKYADTLPASVGEPNEYVTATQTTIADPCARDPISIRYWESLTRRRDSAHLPLSLVNLIGVQTPFSVD